MYKKYIYNLVILGLFVLSSPSFVKAEEDLATSSGNNPVKMVSRIDWGYTAGIQDEDYKNVNHDFRVAAYFAPIDSLSLGFELPFLSFTQPSDTLNKPKFSAGDLKLKTFATLYLSDNKTLSQSSSGFWGLGVGIDITLPTGRAEYQTGGDRFVFDPFIAIGGIFSTSAGSTVIAEMIRFTPTLAMDSGDLVNNSMTSRLILTHIFPFGLFLSNQFNYVPDFIHKGKYDLYDKVQIGQMFNRHFGMTIEITESIQHYYITSPEALYQLWFRYIF